MTTLPKGWTEVALGDVATIERRTIVPEKIRPGTLYVGLEDIERGGSEIRPHAVNAGELGSNKFAFDQTHILFAKLRPYLAKIACPLFEGICSTDILPIRPVGIDQRYLLHYLRQPEIVQHAAARSAGINLPRLAPNELEAFRVPLPLIEEQRRIAAILDKADDLRAKRRAALVQLDTLTQSIFLDMFGDPVVNPKGWPRVPLGDLVASLEYGHRFYGEGYAEHGIRMVRITDVSASGLLDYDAMPRMALAEDDVRRYSLSAGDIIFARSGATVGKVALVESGAPPCIAGAYFIVLRFGPSVVPEFMASTLRSGYVQALIQRTSRQAAQQNFSGPALRRLSVFMPPVEEQERFARRVGCLAARTSIATASFGGLEDLVASLQSRAFRGEL